MESGKCESVFDMLFFLDAPLTGIIPSVAKNTLDVASCRGVAHHGFNAHMYVNVSYAPPLRGTLEKAELHATGALCGLAADTTEQSGGRKWGFREAFVVEQPDDPHSQSGDYRLLAAAGFLPSHSGQGP
ncbi:hypothetical protein MRX96_056825 [Rhipicephalus microplus]